jgi:hypothetical protein
MLKSAASQTGLLKPGANVINLHCTVTYAQYYYVTIKINHRYLVLES